MEFTKHSENLSVIVYIFVFYKTIILTEKYWCQ